MVDVFDFVWVMCGYVWFNLLVGCVIVMGDWLIVIGVI